MTDATKKRFTRMIADLDRMATYLEQVGFEGEAQAIDAASEQVEELQDRLLAL